MYSLERQLPEIRKMIILGSLRRGVPVAKSPVEVCLVASSPESEALCDLQLPWQEPELMALKRMSPVHGACRLQSQNLWAASMGWELKEERCLYWPGWQTLPQAAPLMGSKWGNPRERLRGMEWSHCLECLPNYSGAKMSESCVHVLSSGDHSLSNRQAEC